MKKKILSLALCLAMLLSVGTLMISAEKIDSTTGNVVYANYGTVTVDGTIDDTMQLDVLATSAVAYFGVTWDADYLYVGMSGIVVNDRSSWGASSLANTKGSLKTLDTASVTLENTSASITAAGEKSGNANALAAVSESKMLANNQDYATGVYFAEIAIPMDDVVIYDLGNGQLAVNAKLTYKDSAGGWNNFIGVIVLTDVARLGGYDVAGGRNQGEQTMRTNEYYTAEGTRQVTSQTVANLIASHGFQIGQSVGLEAGHPEVGYTDATATTEITANKAYEGTAWTAYLRKDLVSGKRVIAQEDLNITNLAVTDFSGIAAEESIAINYRSATMKSNATNPNRVLMVVGFDGPNNGYSAMSNGYVIYNTANGLVIGNDQATKAEDFVSLGVGQGTFFTIRLEVAADRSTDVVVNGRKVGTVAASTNEKAFVNGVFCDGGFQTSVTVGNTLTKSTPNIRLRNAYVAMEDENATAALTALKGSNYAKALGSQVTAVTEGKYDARFIFELPGATLANYQSAGYDITVKYNGKTASTSIALTKVYESISADGTPVVTANGGYLAVAAIKGITADTAKDVTFEVTPWVVNNFGGEKVYAETFSVTYHYDGAAVAPLA